MLAPREGEGEADIPTVKMTRSTVPSPAARAASQPALTVSAFSASPETSRAWPFWMYRWISASLSNTDVERRRNVMVAPCSRSGSDER